MGLISNTIRSGFPKFPSNPCNALHLFAYFPSVQCAFLHSGRNHQTSTQPSASIPQLSDEWFTLRKHKLTTSTFSTALGFWKAGNPRSKLWNEKVHLTDPTFDSASKSAMDWGIQNEPKAIEKYKALTGQEVSFLGFATHVESKLGWVGASPDGLLECSHKNGGILEVKCPYNKGKPELALPWKVMPYYYMPQVQGQMEVMDRDWADLYCWTLNGSIVFRVLRDRKYWEMMEGVLEDFWWGNVVPAKHALGNGNEGDVRIYEPKTVHERTSLIVHKSKELASESKMICRDIGGNVQFFE